MNYFIIYNTDILFCDDCLNSIPPDPEHYYKQKYSYCTTSKHLASFGTGIYLYFYYIKFIIYMCLIILGVVAIETIIVARMYNNQITNYCNMNLNYSPNSSDVCREFKLTLNDWLYAMNYENIGKLN